MKGKKFLVEIRTISFWPVVKAEMNFRNLCCGNKMTIIADEMQNRILYFVPENILVFKETLIKYSLRRQPQTIKLSMFAALGADKRPSLSRARLFINSVKRGERT